ncbi:MAG: hypothetical protein R3225_00740 [Halofilum sp. (in: g-proteobacteria)]|nr:hypothetical protein [Halofilum sp. (in: g-proteobacteria)]
MRTFLALAVLTIIALVGALRTPRAPLQLLVLRVSLFIAAGFFGLMLLAAMVEALLAAP